MSTLYLSRLSLRRESSTMALLPLFLGEGGEITPLAGKSLMWAAFGGAGDRDFIWRDAGDGTFFALSHRQPENGSGLFDIECKPFDPSLSIGDRLAFTVRLNAVVRRKRPGQPDRHSVKREVAMDAIFSLEKADRSQFRAEKSHSAICQWMARQGNDKGFSLDPALVEIGDMNNVVVRKKDRNVQFTAVDVTGILTVTDPGRLTEMLAFGLGSSKAYGCGMIMLRKIH